MSDESSLFNLAINKINSRIVGGLSTDVDETMTHKLLRKESVKVGSQFLFII
jgi:hypothetical protein